MRASSSKVPGILLLVLLGACAGGTRPQVESTESPRVTVFKSPDCVCCDGWIEHIEAAGFTTETVLDLAMASRKAGLGVPAHLSSCHTSVVGDYVLEGHVPADAVRNLLRERPDARGLVLPGMPPGSPGMPGRSAYAVLLLGASGDVEVFVRK